MQLALQGRLLTRASCFRARTCDRKRSLQLCRLIVRASEERDTPEDDKINTDQTQPATISESENAAEPSTINQSSDPASPPQQQNLQLPQSVIGRLRDTVFGIDTLFVTSVENYGQSGVLFKGNLRGDPSRAYTKLSARLKEQLGDSYRLFLLEDQESNPVAVVIPAESAEFQSVNPTAEVALALGLGLTTIATTLNINGAELFNAALLIAKFDPTLIASAVPATIATLGILAAHEVGHIAGAKKAKVDLAPPIFIPAGLGLLGSFGAITRIRSAVPNREALATVAAPGPLAGFAVSLGIMLFGLALTAGGVGGMEVDSASFRESLLAGSLAQYVFGERVFTAEALNCNPFFIAGWAGLIVNAINCLPAGELDGGRLFLGLFGRRAASRMSAVTFFFLGIAGITSSLSLYWLLLVLTLQRGPIVPCDEELTPLPQGALKIASIIALILPLLVLLPYPFAPAEVTDGLTGIPVQF